MKFGRMRVQRGAGNMCGVNRGEGGCAMERNR